MTGAALGAVAGVGRDRAGRGAAGFGAAGLAGAGAGGPFLTGAFLTGAGAPAGLGDAVRAAAVVVLQNKKRLS